MYCYAIRYSRLSYFLSKNWNKITRLKRDDIKEELDPMLSSI